MYFGGDGKTADATSADASDAASVFQITRPSARRCGQAESSVRPDVLIRILRKDVGNLARQRKRGAES